MLKNCKFSMLHHYFFVLGNFVECTSYRNAHYHVCHFLFNEVLSRSSVVDYCEICWIFVEYCSNKICLKIIRCSTVVSHTQFPPYLRPGDNCAWAKSFREYQGESRETRGNYQGRPRDYQMEPWETLGNTMGNLGRPKGLLREA